MFDITPNDIALLNDTDLRTLVGHLCEAEMRTRALPTSVVTWSGNQEAPDGGVDVYVDLPEAIELKADWVPRHATGFQVKKQSMPRKKILAEIRPGAVVRQIIRDLAECSGAYIIVSSEDTTSHTALKSRNLAMAEAVQDLPNSGALKLDFYDRGRLATWVRNHAGMVLWVREKIGRPLTGWRSYGPWADASGTASDEYLSDHKLRIHTPTRETPKGIPVDAGLKQIRDLLRQPRAVVRLVGLSGVGKTRFSQALFQHSVGDASLDPSLAFYTNVPDSPDPQPVNLATQLIAAGHRAILVVDNCPFELHNRLSDVCRSKESTLSVLTVEYDIRDDLREGTQVFRLDASSLELIEKLLRGRFEGLSPTDAATIAKFSDGNSRIAIALAGTVPLNETIEGVRDEELLHRLIYQRHDPDPSLLFAGQVCSLVYSFEGRDIGKDSELSCLGGLIGLTAPEIYRHVADLQDRGIIQQRGVWRAVLPHAIANRLAATALRRIPHTSIESCLIQAGPERLLKSFSRRLGFLHTSQEACAIVDRWLESDGMLGDVANRGGTYKEMFEYVAPVLPERALVVLEQCLGNIHTPCANDSHGDYIHVLCSLAYESELFKRCIALLKNIVPSEAQKGQSNRGVAALKSLFQIRFSGTLATVEQRLEVICSLVFADTRHDRNLGLQALTAALETVHIQIFQDFDFGARSRDYGYWPSSQDDVNRWFGLVLELSAKLARSDEPLGSEIRRIVARQLPGIWTAAGAYKAVEDACLDISQWKFWPAGWHAVRDIQRCYGASLPPSVSARLKSLKEELRPRDICQKVQTIVLGWDSIGLRTEDWETSGIDETQFAAGAPVGLMCQQLGEIVAAKEEALDELLPELLCRDGELWLFGRGLALGSQDPSKIWNRLIDALGAIPVDQRKPRILCGFLEVLRETHPSLNEEFLDLAFRDERSASVFPALQSAAGINQRGLERLMNSLALGLTPIWSYHSLAYGGASDTIPGSQLRDLLLEIATRPGGFDVAAEILHMRLDRNDKDKRSNEEAIIDAGRRLIRQVPFTSTLDTMRDYRLGQISSSCLKEGEGATIVAEVLYRLKQEASSYLTPVFYNNELISGLFAANPTVGLDSLCAGNSKELDAGIDIIKSLHQNPLSSIPDDTLIDWCDQAPTGRYLAVASAISCWDGGSRGEPRRWTALAVKLLERAPDRSGVLRIFIRQIGQVGWIHSRASALEECAALLDDLPTFSDVLLVSVIATEKGRFLRESKKWHRKEAAFDKGRDERFE